MKHLLSFDTEHWYESWKMRGLSGWEGLPDCDTHIVRHLLDLLDTHQQTATFFFTGAFAREFPALARECVERGHEVGCHTDSHTMLDRFPNAASLREDIARSVESITEATGIRPQGFRAPKWSLYPQNRDAVLAVLADLGFAYDSSYFPGHFDYAGADVPHRIALGQGKSILEVPATALCIGTLGLKCSIPVGGAYFRIEPLCMIKAMFAQRARQGKPGLFYAHPYDVNKDCHCPAGTPLKLRLIRRLGVHGALKKLDMMLAQIPMTRIDQWLAANPVSVNE